MTINGETARTTRASIQFAVKAIIKPAVTVAMFCTINANASPTKLLTVVASVDNLAPIAPLKNKMQINVTK